MVNSLIVGGKMKYLVIFALALGFSHSVYAGDEIIVGRWCDKMIPNMPQMNSVLTLVVPSSGAPIMKAEFGDGSTTEDTLVEKPGNVFEKAGSSFGDKYRIVTSTGNLQLLDNDGIIRTAERLENSPRAGEC